MIFNSKQDIMKENSANGNGANAVKLLGCFFFTFLCDLWLRLG